MAKIDKKAARLRRALRSRAHIRKLRVPRLSVYKSSQHIYAQIILPNGNKVAAAASTVEKSVKTQLKYTCNIDAAQVVGKLIAERAKSAGISQVAFDRSGYKYHGRIKALAEAARENGLGL
ncbi:MAG: 50S ribosomal protein L18 [Gammaproteobacteria bacterium]|nr:MAG: 50S ribosomal protein L18 [Gammaproteobacteria bacterium]